MRVHVYLALLVANAALYLSAVWLFAPQKPVTPEGVSTFLWMKRTQRLPRLQWYSSDVGHSESVLPFRAALLWVASGFHGFMFPPETLIGIASFFLFCLPVAWMWCFEVAKLLLTICAEHDEAKQLPKDCANARTDTAYFRAQWMRLRFRLALVGTVAFQFALLPLAVVESYSTRPVVLSVAFGMLAMWALLKDESARHPDPHAVLAKTAHCGTQDCDRGKTIILREKGLTYYSARPLPSQRYLMLFWLCWIVALGVEPVFVYILPAGVVWALSACHQHSFLRVLVYEDNVHNGEEEMENMRKKAETDSIGRLGTSMKGHYMGTLRRHDRFTFACSVSKLILLTLAVLLIILYLFCDTMASAVALVNRFLPASSSLFPLFSSGTERATDAFFSVTGALEARQLNCRTLLHHAHRWCPIPTANLWFLAEYYSLVPWTAISKVTIQSFSTYKGAKATRAAQVLVGCASILCVCILHVVPLFVVISYRWRKPVLSFESPAARRIAFARVRRCIKIPRSTRITALSRSEYILKQCALFGWLLLFSGVVCGLLTGLRDGRGAPRFAPLVVAAAPLFGLCAMRRVPAVSGGGPPVATNGPRPAAAADGIWLIAATAAAGLSSAAAALPFGAGMRVEGMRIARGALVAAVGIAVAARRGGPARAAAAFAAAAFAAVVAAVVVTEERSETTFVEMMRAQVLVAALLTGVAVYATGRLLKLFLEPEELSLG